MWSLAVIQMKPNEYTPTGHKTYPNHVYASDHIHIAAVTLVSSFIVSLTIAYLIRCLYQHLIRLRGTKMQGGEGDRVAYISVLEFMSI